MTVWTTRCRITTSPTAGSVPRTRSIRWFEPNFHELEYFVPFENGRDATAAVRELMVARLPVSVFPMEVRSVARDEAFLSHSYGRDTAVISISGMPGTDYWPYLRERYHRRPISSSATEPRRRCAAREPQEW